MLIDITKMHRVPVHLSQSSVIRWRYDQDLFTPCPQIWGHGEGKGRRKMRQVNSQRSPCRCTTNIYLDRLLVVIIVHPTTPIITNLPHQQSSSSSSWIDNSSCVFQCTETCATIWLTGWPYFFHYMEAFPESILLKRKQDHQWWRYHRRLFDYQSPYF